MKKENVLGKLPDLDNVLTPQEREEVLREMQVHVYRKNELIYSEGDRPSHMLCLISGKVKIYICISNLKVQTTSHRPTKD